MDTLWFGNIQVFLRQCMIKILLFIFLINVLNGFFIFIIIKKMKMKSKIEPICQNFKFVITYTSVHECKILPVRRSSGCSQMNWTQNWRWSLKAASQGECRQHFLASMYHIISRRIGCKTDSQFSSILSKVTYVVVTSFASLRSADVLSAAIVPPPQWRVRESQGRTGSGSKSRGHHDEGWRTESATECRIQRGFWWVWSGDL